MLFVFHFLIDTTWSTDPEYALWEKSWMIPFRDPTQENGYEVYSQSNRKAVKEGATVEEKHLMTRSLN